MHYSSKVGIFAFNVFNVARDFCETKNFKEPYNHFIGCGALIRKDVFDIVGVFDSLLFIYCHEFDFAIRVIDKGYKIQYSESALIYHRVNLKSLNDSPVQNRFYFFYSTLNNLLLNFKYLNTRKNILITSKYILNRLLVSLYFHYTLLLVKAIFILLKKILKGEIQKYKVKEDTLKFYQYRNIPVFDREFFGKLTKSYKKNELLAAYLRTFFLSKNAKKRFVQ